MRRAEKNREQQRHLAEAALQAVAKARALHGEGSATGSFLLRVAKAHARLAGGEIKEVKS